MIRPTLVFLILLCGRALAQSIQPTVDEVRERAITQLTRLEKCPGVVVEFKLKGAFYEGAYKLEKRGEQCWLEGVRYVGGTPAELKANKQDVELLANIAGKGNTNFITSFDGRNQATFNPLISEAELKPAASFTMDAGFTSLFPENWATFHNYQRVPDLRLAAILEARDNVDIEWHGRKVQFSRDADEAAKLPKGSVEVDIDQGYHVTAYHMELTSEITWDGQFTWEQDGGHWFVKRGEQRTNGVLLAKWDIQQISFDLNHLRSNFSMTKRELPFGTKITRASDNPKDDVRRKDAVEYVGGKAGEEEYRLRRLAIANKRLKQ